MNRPKIMKNLNENPLSLDKKAFVTGASRGIGRAIAVALAKTGHDVLLHYHKNETAAQDSAQQIKSLGRRTWLYRADLCDTTQTQKMLDQIVEEHKTLDVYVANAASTAFKPLIDVNHGNIEKTFTLVVMGFINTVQKLRPLLKNRDSQILTLSGIDTLQYCPGHGLLAAAKSALETLTRYFSVELSADKIHMKCLNPGLVATDSTRFYLGSAFEDICAKANATAPHGGFAEPEQIAKLALWLLAPESNGIAGKMIVADGGLSFMLPGF